MVQRSAVQKQNPSRARRMEETAGDDPGRPLDDLRTPEQRDAMLAWADRYVAAGCRTLDEQEEDRAECVQ